MTKNSFGARNRNQNERRERGEDGKGEQGALQESGMRYSGLSLEEQFPTSKVSIFLFSIFTKIYMQ